MMLHKARTVLIDLERTDVAGSAEAGAHPLGLSPARLPCSLHADDLEQLRAFASGDRPTCDLVLAFRFQDLDDLGVSAILPSDRLAGLFDTSGAVLVDIPATRRPAVRTTQESGGGVSLSRPGRHLLCAHFHGAAQAEANAASPAKFA